MTLSQIAVHILTIIVLKTKQHLLTGLKAIDIAVLKIIIAYILTFMMLIICTDNNIPSLKPVVSAV